MDRQRKTLEITLLYSRYHYLEHVSTRHRVCPTQPSAGTGMSSFQCSFSYHPPLFPAQEEEEEDIPYAQHCCKQTWSRAKRTLLQSVKTNKRQPIAIIFKALKYHIGQRVMLGTKDIHLKTLSRTVLLL